MASFAGYQARQRLFAKGRLPAGEKNRTEQRFEDEWVKPRAQSGEIIWWAFEGITLKLAKDCRLTMDFFIQLASGELQAWDVKGSFAIVEGDALVKMRVAAGKFPLRFFMAAPKPKRDGGGWLIKEFGHVE